MQNVPSIKEIYFSNNFQISLYFLIGTLFAISLIFLIYITYKKYVVMFENLLSKKGIVKVIKWHSELDVPRLVFSSLIILIMILAINSFSYSLRKSDTHLSISLRYIFYLSLCFCNCISIYTFNSKKGFEVFVKFIKANPWYIENFNSKKKVKVGIVTEIKMVNIINLPEGFTLKDDIFLKNNFQQYYSNLNNFQVFKIGLNGGLVTEKIIWNSKEKRHKEGQSNLTELFKMVISCFNLDEYYFEKLYIEKKFTEYNKARRDIKDFLNKIVRNTFIYNSNNFENSELENLNTEIALNVLKKSFTSLNKK